MPTPIVHPCSQPGWVGSLRSVEWQADGPDAQVVSDYLQTDMMHRILNSNVSRRAGSPVASALSPWKVRHEAA